jgi:hypothetical protein
VSFVIAYFCFLLIFRISWVLGNRVYFLTTSIRVLVQVGAMAREEANIGIENFDGIDFEYWKMQIEDYLYGKKLHLPLLGEIPNRMKDDE